MIKEKYLNQIKQKIEQFNKDKKLEFFIYGSSLTKDHFGDIDLGVLGEINSQQIMALKDECNNSNLPYSVDITNFDEVSKEFRDNVFNNKILWITR